MPVRTVTTFIPPVAAKSHSELSGSLTPVHPHLPVHESPHLSQRLRSKLGPRRAAGPAKVTFPTSPPPSCQRSHCVKAQADNKPPVRWTHEVNDNHIHPPARATLIPHAHPRWLTRTTRPPKGTTSVASPSSSRDTQPPPFTPQLFRKDQLPGRQGASGIPLRCEHSRGDSLFLGKQAQPYVLVRPSTPSPGPPYQRSQPMRR